jgi:hypothetical protein
MSRVLMLDAGEPLDIFDVIEIANGVVHVRTAYLFELGEEVKLRLENDGTITEANARVRAHVGTGRDRVTEFELTD